MKEIEDKEFGVITLKKRLNARNYTLRVVRGKVSVSLPYYGSYRRALELVEIHRDKLIQKMSESASRILSVEEEEVLRSKAKRYLPVRLEQLAQKHDFSYQSVRIRKSRTRWGSCSSKKTISLSFYLMLLPEHLADYVLLHELCHTVHMNHGPEFWQLLNRVTDNCAKDLRKELKSYRL